MRAKIPDLQFKVTRVHSTFYRAKYALVFYRHDKDHKPYIDDVQFFIGQNGTMVRSKAFKHGRAVVTRQAPRGIRSLFIPHDAVAPIRALGIGEPCNG
jgi:hypothetical protein